MVDYYEFEGMMEDVGLGMSIFGMLMGILGVVVLIALVVAAVQYIFQSIGLYTIANRRGIKNPWLAWIPGGNYWIAGTLADQYQYVAQGKIKNYRKIILVLWLVQMAVSVAAQCLVGSSMDVLLEMLEYGELGEAGAAVGASAGFGQLLSLVESGVSMAVLVFWHISLYNLYNSCDPKNAVLYLVLGIVFGVTVPFFIFACRNKDGGMPPRKVNPEQPAYQPLQKDVPVHEPPREPWENNPEV